MDKNDFKWDIPIPKFDKPIENNDVRKIDIQIDMRFIESDKIECEWDEEGNPIEFEHGFLMEPVEKLKEQYLYRGEDTSFQYSMIENKEFDDKISNAIIGYHEMLDKPITAFSDLLKTKKDKEFDALSNTFVSEPNTDDLKPDNQCGGSEVSECDICGKVTSVARKYYYYPVLCDCHGPTHAEMVKYCKDCTPIEPESTMICTHHEDGSQWNILVPTNIFIKTKER